MEVLIWVGKLTWFFLPAGLANMAPVLMRKRWKRLALPLDGGYKIWGDRILGDHKTWRGLVVALIFGGSLFIVQKGLAAQWPLFQQFSAYDYALLPWWFGVAFAFGAIGGDAVKSFFKRRFHIADGDSWFPFDQLDFYIGATLILMLFANVEALTWFTVLAVGPSIHILVNRLGFKLKMKDSPW